MSESTQARALAKDGSPRCLRSLGVPALLALGPLLAPAPAWAGFQFDDVTAAAGRFPVTESWGAAVADINGDGWTDVFFNGHRLRPYLYRNNGDGTFTDVTLRMDRSGTWVTRSGDQHGGSFGDFDNDGDQDLLVATGACCPAQFFVNDGGWFVDRTPDWNLSADGGGRNDNWVDIDGDSYLDLAQGAFNASVIWQQVPGVQFGTRNGPTGFHCGPRTNHVHLADFSTDGVADLLCMREGGTDNLYDISAYAHGSQFIDISSNMEQIPLVTDSAVGDFDGNLQSDLVALRGLLRQNDAVLVNGNRIEAMLDRSGSQTDPVGFSFQGGGQVSFNVDSRSFGPGIFYLGSGGAHPTSVPFVLDSGDPQVQGVMAGGPPSGPAVTIGYQPGSGWDLRVYGRGTKSVRGYFTLERVAGPDLANVRGIGLGVGDLPMRPRLLLNDNGALADAGASWGLDQAVSCASVGVGDFDNDGDLDLYMVCRGGAANLPNRAYQNTGSGFTEIANGAGAQGPVGAAVGSGAGTGDSVVVADFDRDGFLDLLVTNGLNLQPGRSSRPPQIGGPVKVYRNRGNSNHWIELDLVGVRSNRDGLGARVYVTRNGTTQLREQDGGYHRWSQNDRRIHFGLGAAGGPVERIRVEWPSGSVNEVTNVPVDGLYRFTEGSSGLTSGQIQSVPLRQVARDPLPPSGAECGQPPYRTDYGPVLLVWRDCPTRGWHLQAQGGGSDSDLIFQGRVESSQPFESVAPVQTEGPDLVTSPTSSTLTFQLKVKNKDSDQVSFQAPAGSSLCLRLTAPLGQDPLVGEGRWAVTGATDLATLRACP